MARLIRMLRKLHLCLCIALVGYSSLGCKTASIPLNFESGMRGAFITNEQYSGELPRIILITTPTEAVSPGKGATFPPEMETLLKQVDFTQELVILISVGQISENSRIKEIYQIRDTIHINLENYSVGPGNYVLPGQTMPYQLILVEKVGQWDTLIEFVVNVENETILDAFHFVP